jgi:hypothetical protein
MSILFIFLNYRLNPKILSCFSPNLTPEYEHHLHHFDVCYTYGAATINFIQFLSLLGLLQSYVLPCWYCYV